MSERSERERIELAMARLESQRAVLGDSVVDTALASLRRQLDALQGAARAAAPTMEGERKLVTVVFADISGFTAMSEKMDPEQVRDVINACFERLVPAVSRYGGTVCRFIGDAIMALFGAPVAHENDPERALHAALEMMRAVADLNAEQKADLGLHIGVNTGLVVAGGLGTSEMSQYSVTGDAVNLASRLEDASARGEILVGPDTYRSTAQLFSFERLEPILVKGKAEPVQVYRLLGTREGRARGLESRGISSPLVGRDGQFATLAHCFDQVQGGRGGVVFVTGEAGLGKSRLVAEAKARVIGPQASAPGGLRWLEGRSVSFGQTISYWPFQEIIRNHVGITDEDSEHLAWTKLERRLSVLFPEQVAEVLPYLASMLALEVRGTLEERVKYLDGEAMRSQVFITSRHFFERLARERPTVLVFEDLHWADRSSVELVEHLVPLVEQAPLLICCVSRPFRETQMVHLFDTAARGHAAHCTEISLAPLSSAESAQLVRNLLQIEGLTSQWREVILGKAEGNPFFIEEVLRSLIDQGAVEQDPSTGRWRATAQMARVTVPGTIQGVVMARVDRLERDVKQVLQMASVIGRSFLYRVLHAIARMERELDRHLGELQQLELVREKRQVPELEYMFKHGLAHEAVYESVLVQRRQELHAQVGACIETLFTDRQEQFCGLLAYHYAQAEKWEKAQEYLFKAGNQAGQMAADAEALAHYQQALAAYSRAFGDRWDPLQQATLERRMGEAYYRQGNHQQGIECLERALTRLGHPFPTTPGGVRLALVREIVRQVGHSLFPGLFKGEIGQAEPAAEESARIYAIKAWMNYFVNQERCLLDSILGLNVAERSGFALGIVESSMGIAAICGAIGAFHLAGRFNRQGVALAEQTRIPTAIGMAYLGVGLIELYSGRWGEATIDILRKAASAYWEAGDLREWGVLFSQLRQVFTWRGQFDRSVELGRGLVRIGEESSDPQMRAWGLEALGTAWRRTGNLDEAIESLEEAIEVYKAVPNYLEQAGAGGELGMCHLRRGEPEKAVAVLEEAVEIIASRGLWLFIVNSPRNGLAEAYLAMAEQAEGAERKAWMKKARQACQAILKESRRFRSGMPGAARLQGRYEWLRGREASARSWWRRSLAAAAELGARYELGMTHLEMGRRLGGRESLEQAKTILTRAGAGLDAAQAQELLEGAATR